MHEVEATHLEALHTRQQLTARARASERDKGFLFVPFIVNLLGALLSYLLLLQSSQTALSVQTCRWRRLLFDETICNRQCVCVCERERRKIPLSTSVHSNGCSSSNLLIPSTTKPTSHTYRRTYTTHIRASNCFVK